MIKATFYKDSEKGSFYGFNIKGHSGYAESGSDIVCAAVSSMVILFVNTIDGVFNVPYDFKMDEETAEVDFKLKVLDESSSKAIFCLRECIESVAMDYPAFVKVSETLSAH